MKGVIYVGAHYGEYYEEYLSEGAINFMMFEPVMANFVKLQRIMGSKPGVKLYNTALGDFWGKVRMHTEYEHQGRSCSILEPLKHLEQYPDIVFRTSELVSINQLDRIIYDHALYDFLHLDCQGYELEVLKGAKRSLNDINEIQCEVYREELYRDCPMIDDVVKYLKDFDFVSVRWRGMTWGDAKFTRHV